MFSCLCFHFSRLELDKCDFFHACMTLKWKCTKAAIISIYKLGSAFTTVVLLRNKHDKNTGHHTVTVVSGGGKTRDHPCFDRKRRWLC